MFKEFDEVELEKWNGLSEEERKQYIEKDDVQLAINVDIKIESHGIVAEEHKYYHVFSQGILIHDIRVISINEQETVFSIKTFNNEMPETFSVKTNEEKSIEVGYSPYKHIYKIKVSNITYGRVLEL